MDLKKEKLIYVLWSPNFFGGSTPCTIMGNGWTPNREDPTILVLPAAPAWPAAATWIADKFRPGSPEAKFVSPQLVDPKAQEVMGLLTVQIWGNGETIAYMDLYAVKEHAVQIVMRDWAEYHLLEAEKIDWECCQPDDGGYEHGTCSQKIGNMLRKTGTCTYNWEDDSKITRRLFTLPISS